MLSTLILLLLAQNSETTTNEGRRIAIFVGNAAYGRAPIPGAVQTAQRVQSAFRPLGFETILLANASMVEIQRAVAMVASKVTSKDTIVLYYRGHVIPGEFQNSLLALDHPPESVGSALPTFWYGTGYSLKSLMESLQAARSFLLILDAPIDHPFAVGRDRPRGLTAMKPPKNGVVIFASEAGKPISGNEDGAFANAVQQHLQSSPDTTVSALFAAVRTKVRNETSGKLSPWISAGSREAGAVVLRGPEVSTASTETVQTWDDARFHLMVAESRILNRPALREHNRKMAMAYFDASQTAAVENAAKQPQKGEFETLAQYKARTGFENAPSAALEEKIRAERAKLEAVFEDTTGDREENIDPQRPRQFSGPCKADWVSYDADRKLLTLFVAGADRLFDMTPEEAQRFKPRSGVLKCGGGLSPETTTVTDPEGQTILYERPWQFYRSATAPKPLARFEPVFPTTAAKARIRSSVVQLTVLVEETGAPSSIRVMKGAGFGFDEAAVAAARKWRFKPGMHEGKAVPAEFPLTMSFFLRND